MKGIKRPLSRLRKDSKNGSANTKGIKWRDVRDPSGGIEQKSSGAENTEVSSETLDSSRDTTRLSRKFSSNRTN